MKKLLAIVLAIAMVVTMAACGSTSGSSSGNAAPAAQTGSNSGSSPEAPAAATSDNLAKVKDDKVYIGVCSHLTGQYRSSYEYWLTSFTTVCDDINNNGGIGGKQLELVWFDCGEEVQTAINAYELAAEDERLSMIFFSQYSVLGAAVLDLIDEAKIPTILLGSNPILNVGKEYAWMVRPSDVDAAKVMVDYVMDKCGAKNPATVMMAGMETGIFSFIQEDLKNDYGFDMSSDRQFIYATGEQNYGPIASTAAAIGADAYFLCCNQTDGASAVAALTAAGVTGMPRIANSTLASQYVVDLAGEALDGWCTVSENFPAVDNEENKAYVELFTKVNGYAPSADEYYGYLLYYAKALLEAAPSVYDRDGINAAIKQIEFVTPTQTLKYYGNETFDDHDLASNMFILKYDGTELKLEEMVSYR